MGYIRGDRKPHIHVVIPRKNLLTGKEMNPVGDYERNVEYFEAFQEHVNQKQTHDVFQSISLIEQPGELLRRLHTLVQSLPAEQITVQALADALRMSQRTLARKVQAETGTAVATYVRRIKLGQVGERLTLTSASLKSICDELGFSSDSNLRRMFKELTGLTPTEYRQRFARF